LVRVGDGQHVSVADAQGVGTRAAVQLVARGQTRSLDVDAVVARAAGEGHGDRVIHHDTNTTRRCGSIKRGRRRGGLEFSSDSDLFVASESHGGGGGVGASAIEQVAEVGIRTGRGDRHGFEVFGARRVTDQQVATGVGAIQLHRQGVSGAGGDAILELHSEVVSASVTAGPIYSRSSLDVSNSQGLCAVVALDGAHASGVSQVKEVGAGLRDQLLHRHGFNIRQIDSFQGIGVTNQREDIFTSATVDHISSTKGLRVGNEIVVARGAAQVVDTGSERNSALKISPQRINDLRAF